jgi:hypothetical protein
MISLFIMIIIKIGRVVHGCGFDILATADSREHTLGCNVVR